GVELGFVEEAAPWRLRSDQFPCKVGGRPAWLGEAGLPGPSELRCGVCGQPCAFLLQLYAPVQERPEAFHRSLFLFGCRRPSCYRPAGPAPGSLRVFRNQLPRKNDTYSYNPPPEEPPLEELHSVNLQLKCGAMLCRVCGCLGPSTCSKCHKAHYCSKDHQIKDWKAGHKVSCLQPGRGGDLTAGLRELRNNLVEKIDIFREQVRCQQWQLDKHARINLFRGIQVSL
uniref:Programmed cell death 2 n=1 Tax=Laticauda laticaudata TaxID=8630 RepID=A0A8C5RWR8_LATLA